MRLSFLNHIFTGVTICSLLLSLTTGCENGNERDILLYGPNEGSGEDKISLSFFGFKADAMNLTATEAALQSFMSEHQDIIITYEGIKGLAYWDAFEKRDATDTLDDVVMIHHDHVVTLSAQGKLADLSDLHGLENYTDEVKGQFTNADGSVYFLPTSISTYNLYVNYDLLNIHGQTIPKNWAEFQQVCDYFVCEGVVPIIANNHNSLSTLILSKGLFDVYQQSEPDIDMTIQKFNETPSFLAETLAPGVKQVAEMLERGWFDADETLATEQTSDDLELFLQGDRPFMISGGWASTRVVAREPDFSYGVYPYPILDDGSVLSIQVDTCISVNARSEHLTEAKEFVEYLIQPDVMWTYCDSQASYTPLREEERLPSESTLIPSTECLTNGRIAFRAEYRLNLPMETALLSCSRALLEGGTAAEAQEVLLQELQK